MIRLFGGLFQQLRAWLHRWIKGLDPKADIDEVSTLLTSGGTWMAQLTQAHGDAPQTEFQPVPARNTSLSVHFVIRGADKRRVIAYSKAKTLQRELGVIPTLVCVK